LQTTYKPLDCKRLFTHLFLVVRFAIFVFQSLAMDNKVQTTDLQSANLPETDLLPEANEVQTTEQPQANEVQTTKQPQANEVQTIKQPQANEVQTTKQPTANNAQTIEPTTPPEPAPPAPIQAGNSDWVKKGMTTALNAEQIEAVKSTVLNAPAEIKNVNQLLLYLVAEKQASHSKQMELVNQVTELKLNTQELEAHNAELERHASDLVEAYTDLKTQWTQKEAEILRIIEDTKERAKEAEQLQETAQKQTQSGAQFLLSIYGIKS
jgi:hypothetical protein